MAAAGAPGIERMLEILENEVISEAGEFLFVPAGVPHEAVNLSATEAARAVVARNHPAEQDQVQPYVVE